MDPHQRLLKEPCNPHHSAYINTLSRSLVHTLTNNHITQEHSHLQITILHKNTMENPNDSHFPPNQTQHNRGPINAGRNASTLPMTEDTKRPIIGAQAQLPKRKRVAGGANVKATKALALDLNVPPVLYKCVLCKKTYEKKKALCGHMKGHPHRSWKGLEPPSDWKSINLNEAPRDEDSEI